MVVEVKLRRGRMKEPSHESYCAIGISSKGTAALGAGKGKCTESIDQNTTLLL